MNDDDDGDDDSESDGLNRVQLDLLQVTAKLAEQRIIDDAVKLALVRLISRRDARLVAAHEAYRRQNDQDDLIDSMLRLARLELSGGDSGRAAAQQKPTVEIEMVDVKKSSAPTQRPKILDKEDRKNILAILLQSKVLSSSGARFIAALIDQDDPTIDGVFLQYEEDKDVKLLMKSIQEIIAIVEGGGDDDDVDDEVDGDSDNNLDEEEEPTDDQMSIEARFMRLISGMKLSELDTVALRLAISKSDPAISRALETYRRTNDDEYIVAELREIARRTRVENLDNNGYEVVSDDGESDDEGKEDNEGDEDDEDDEYLANLEMEAAQQMRGTQSSRKEEEGDYNEDDDDYDDDDYEEDDDDDDEESPQGQGGFMSSVSSRQQIFPLLVSELRSEKMISEDEASTLMRLFQQGNEVLNAALDVYDVDNDMAELVDTLNHIAKANERTSSSPAKASPGSAKQASPTRSSPGR
jgi:hypothetical protein